MIAEKEKTKRKLALRNWSLTYDKKREYILTSQTDDNMDLYTRYAEKRKKNYTEIVSFVRKSGCNKYRKKLKRRK